jgi:protein TonB
MRPPVPPTLRLPVARRRAAALALSLALHAVIVGLLLSDAARRSRHLPAAGLLELARGGGGVGGREHGVVYIALPSAGAEPAPVPVPRPPVRRPVIRQPLTPAPVPAPAPPAPIDTAPAAAAESVAAAGSALAAGAGGGPGVGDGRGGGVGTGSGGAAGQGAGGEGGRGVAPEPRQLVLPPPDRPRELSGRQVEVTFFVAADGRVERVVVVPAIADGGFAKKFEDAMRSYRFRPARSPAGTPVSGSTTLTVSF